MKHNKRTITSAALLGLMLTTATVTLAQTTVRETTTTTTSAGTISEFGPETIIIRSETSPEPIRYSYTKTTTYVDENGAPVSIETVKSGLPVTVYYVRVGDRMVASKVIVRNAIRTNGEKQTTTARTTEPDNTARNARDRNGQTPTPLDQGNNKADVETTAQIRKAIIAGKDMSVNAQNVKIITNKGRVTLRGPVNTAEEKRLIGVIAINIARLENVDNQLEVK